MARKKYKRIDSRGRHYAIRQVDEHKVEFECPVGHRYVQQLDTKIAPVFIKRFIHYWSRENHGVTASVGDCRRCVREGAFK